MDTLKGLLLVLAVVFNISFKQDYKLPLQLDWETHFKGKADENSPYLALTSTTWAYSYKSVVNRNRVKVDLTNTVTLDPDKSWVKWDKIKDPVTRANLLHHEQGHINIQNILLQEADRVLKNRTYSVKNYKTEIAELARQISAYYELMQKDYDLQTEHGSNHKMQARWDRIIEEKTAEATVAVY